ncbi:hypothetical protein RFI_31546 [Reticulomyxa filosa]|uniref:N-acetyltransferase domain-containing protein n=1 Tax=Reticulomyxa filosa TaxID=46433 RepID=X6LVA0_RETFI|nr:hypothetical protein RFI_31546 [Reticulomyxa filosa]|eukprot:ETO05848.1 hypothetical protein RFI_31546 [Reticulomyxa filosa]
MTFCFKTSCTTSKRERTQERKKPMSAEVVENSAVVEGDVESALKIHDQVFGHDDKYSSAKLWQDRVATNKGKILTLDRSAFLVVYIRECDGIHSSLQNKNGSEDENKEASKKHMTYHIWQAGVIPEMQGKGHFTRLWNYVIEHIPHTIDTISISTYPEKFTTMWSWVQKSGFKVMEKFEDGKVYCEANLNSFSLFKSVSPTTK